jgi:hypothetical protein
VAFPDGQQAVVISACLRTVCVRKNSGSPAAGAGISASPICAWAARPSSGQKYRHAGFTRLFP